jgi:hypothetical protein
MVGGCGDDRKGKVEVCPCKLPESVRNTASAFLFALLAVVLAVVLGMGGS